MLDPRNSSRIFLPNFEAILFSRACVPSAERSEHSPLDGVAERMEVLKRSGKKQLIRSEAKEPATRGSAETISTQHLRYYGNGVWCSEARHPDAA
jgi:hypothetical protein